METLEMSMTAHWLNVLVSYKLSSRHVFDPELDFMCRG